MEELTLIDYLTILKQRKSVFLTAFGIIFVISLIVTMSWSNYRSTATVEIEQPQVAPDMTTPMGMNPNNTPEALADLRISKIQQTVLSPSSLVEIITKFDLYPDRRTHEPMASVADHMADKVKLTLISSVVANPAATQKVSVDQLSAIAFTLSFDYGDPQLAQKVTNEIVTRFLDEDLKDRRNEAQVTSDFIQEQIAQLEATMVEQEKKIAAFEDEHGISRPETLMFNQQAAANVALSLQNLDTQIATNEGTQGSLRAQLASVDPYSRVIADGQVMTTPAIQLKALQAQYTTLTAQYGPQHPDVLKVKRQIAALSAETGIGNKIDTGPLKAQITDIETNLKAAEASKGPDHPDTVALRDQLASLKKQLADAGERKVSALHEDADNPAYIAITSELDSAETQHKTLLEQREKLQAQQEKYQEAVLANPGLQQQMAGLTRDYDNAQLRYRELKEKKMAADMDKQMIEDRKGQRLAIISPPQLPLKTHPRQLLLFLAGIMLSLMGGVGSVAVSQMVSQSLLGEHHLESLVGVAPLITIPHIYTADEKSQTHYRKSQTLLRKLIAKHADFLNPTE